MTSSLIQPPSDRPRLRLNSVTLCAVSSSNLKATVAAMRASLAQIEFAEALLFTHRAVETLDLGDEYPIKVIAIEPMRSSEAYSRFVLERLGDHITTNHCLIVQWDGHVIDAGRWQDAFLDYDYIGASWPQFNDGYNVGNGGFSLRSHRLMEACQQADFQCQHPEDVAIGRTNRAMLERIGLNFAPAELADQFSAERAGDPASTFGYHGVFLMPEVLGSERFWRLYLSLDERSTAREDWLKLLLAIQNGRSWFLRSLIFIGKSALDVLFSKLRS